MLYLQRSQLRDRTVATTELLDSHAIDNGCNNLINMQEGEPPCSTTVTIADMDLNDGLQGGWTNLPMSVTTMDVRMRTAGWLFVVEGGKKERQRR